MKVYLAGKIKGSQGWRDEFVPGWSKCVIRMDNYDPSKAGGCYFKTTSGESWAAAKELPEWPTYEAGFLGVADYVGPYAIMNAFGSKEHNWIFQDCLTPDAWPTAQTKEKRKVVNQCFMAINSCDVVVAFFNGHDSPGMLCELGYAKAKSRPIIGIARGVLPDWFPMSVCDDVNFFEDSSSSISDISEWLKSDFHRTVSRIAKENIQIYYRSPHWKSRRQESLDKSGNKCQFCAGSSGLSVHHNSYENLYREPDCDLVVLCDPCHRAADAKRRAREAIATN